MARTMVDGGAAAPKVTNVGSSSAATSTDANGKKTYYTDGQWYYADGTRAPGPGAAAPPASGGSSGGSGGGAGGVGTAPAPTDWSIILGTYGLPSDVVDQLNQIWKASNGDANVATPLAMNYVMGTQWFKDNYPGYFSGLNHGLYTDIRGYISYQNDLNQLYGQYFNRPPTSAEISGYLTNGTPIGLIGNQLQSQATLGTISDPLKNIFTPDELKAYSDERSGIDSALGQKLLGEVNLWTQVNPLFQSFYGRAPTRAELDTLTANGTDPAQVAQQFKSAGYMNAINPTLKNVFSQDELQQMATEAAGGDTKTGKQLLDMASLATSLNEVYQIHYGSNVTRDELNLAYTQGYTAQRVDAMLSSGDYAGALPANVKALFTPDELKQAGEQASGFSSSADGERLLNIVKGAGNYASLASQYGETLTADQLKNFYDTGLSASDYGNQLQGKAWANANKTDIQQVSGSFGAGELTPEQLNTLGAEKSGFDTPGGQALAAAFAKAQARMNGVFQGTLQKSNLPALVDRRNQADTSDVSA